MESFGFEKINTFHTLEETLECVREQLLKRVQDSETIQEGANLDEGGWFSTTKSILSATSSDKVITRVAFRQDDIFTEPGTCQVSSTFSNRLVVSINNKNMWDSLNKSFSFVMDLFKSAFDTDETFAGVAGELTIFVGKRK